MICTAIDARGDFASVDATPIDFTLFELTEHATSGGRLLIVLRRPSDGASKMWDIATLQRRDNNVVVNLANQGAAAIGFAADLTLLTAAGIAFFTSGVNVGVKCTGLAGTMLEWCIRYNGVQIID